jgi:hypothetical protein
MAIKGSCHCGMTEFEIDGDLPDQVTRCTCSFCAKRGAVTAAYSPDQFHLLGPPAGEGTYRWQTKMVTHHFCPVCGCATYTDSPAFEMDGKWDGHTRRIVVNARLFDDFDAAAAEVEVIDGKHLW